ncbi:hypothetical protein AVEN_265210-1 [Araneus ventricosus]|uniref:Tc1-like transposase DDE domain-containing protein n=1 Tax=Araneus ventricosus TaxID=182803 RepID=A0A4Y2CSA2_ARAVE|nr:hypothetical protein AVEN_265210-1 [Araneus ventricosus]
MPDDFLLQDDNARPHGARIVDDYLQQETIPQTLATLATALREQWLSLPTERIERIIQRTSLRMEGGYYSTSYEKIKRIIKGCTREERLGNPDLDGRDEVWHLLLSTVCRSASNLGPVNIWGLTVYRSWAEVPNL